MTPTPPSTNSSTGGRSPEAQFRVVRKRNRVPLSCYPCRTRKLKCDRSHPCSNCTKREGQGTASCTYAAPVARRKNQSQGESSPDDMQSRIDRLEGLVLSLMHGGANIDPAITASGSAEPSTSRSVTDSGSSAKVDGEPAHEDGDGNEESDIEDDLATSLGVLKVDSNMGKSMYIGQEHWHTILADIAEVKNYFMTYGKTELESSYERMRSSKPATAREGPTLLLGAVPASEIELRAELPPKSTVLALCSRYFNSMDNAVNIIHGPTFQQQLQAHWQDPAKTPLMWLGMVYSILCIAMLSYHKAGDEPPEWKGRAMDLASEYRLRTVQCLIKADYTKPAEYTIETMLLYVFGEYSSRWDADVGIWLIVSIINRTAYRMGYHRDPKWFPSIPPFQAEMRRRVWAMVRMADVVFSHQVSLPSMIHEDDCDTDLPSNIFDDELLPGMKVMPPPRPNTEPTPIAYMIAKARLCNELGNILQATNRVGKSFHYDEVIRFDAKLRQIMQEMPPHLKLTPLEGSHDPVTLIISRFNMEILYLKIMCLLHRKYMTKARQNPRYAHSRRSAIEASMQALNHLAVLHRESQQTGRLRSLAWFIKSIATKDFVLPAMLIVLDLHYDNMAMQSGQQEEVQDGAETWSPEQRAEMIEAVQTAGTIWQELSHTSMVALKAGKVIDIMLKKIQDPARQRQGSSISSGSESIPSMVANFGIDPSPTFSQDFLSPSSLPTTGTGVSPTDFAQPLDISESSAFMDFGLYPGMGMGMGSDFQMEGLTATGAQSPFSILANLGGNTAGAGGLGATQEVPSTIDWNTFENYAQMANWGADQGFQAYGTGEEQNPPTN